MADMPWYLQGSQTGNIMYPQTDGVLQGAIAGAQYPAGTQSAVSGATLGAQTPFSMYEEMLRRGYTPEQAAPYKNYGAPSGAGVSSYSSPAVSGSVSGAQQGSGILGLNSPYQQATDARNASIMNSPINRSIQGGSGGGGSSFDQGNTGASSGGYAMGAPVGGMSAAPSFGSPAQYTGGQGLTYTPPQDTQQPNGNGVLGMQQANPQAGMQNYLNTTGNQLLGDPSYQRFEHSPGYQYAVNEALNQVQANNSSRGLLDSGRGMRNVTDRAQGMALQDYGNWWNRQNQLYGDYQNRLAGLAGGSTGSEQAYGTGQALGAGSALMGSNLASLFGNQGTSGYGGMVNTGAAQAGNIQQAGGNQAQINSANQSTLLAGMMSGRGY